MTDLILQNPFISFFLLLVSVVGTTWKVFDVLFVKPRDFRIAVLEKNVEEAVESVHIAELNFREGMATNLDVSSVRVALSEARTNYTQALFDYAVALAALEKAVGLGGDSPER